MKRICGKVNRKLLWKKAVMVCFMVLAFHTVIRAEDNSFLQQQVEYGWQIEENGSTDQQGNPINVAWKYFKGGWSWSGEEEREPAWFLISLSKNDFWYRISVDGENFLMPMNTVWGSLAIHTPSAETYDGELYTGLLRPDGYFYSDIGAMNNMWQRLNDNNSITRLDFSLDWGAIQGQASRVATFSFIIDQSQAPFSEVSGQL